MARRSGSVPPGIARKSERLKQGLTARKKLLEKALEQNWGIDEVNHAGIPSEPSQKRIIEWHDPDKGIYRLSLNTAKRHATIFGDITSLLKTLQDRISTKPKRSQAGASGPSDVIRRLREEKKDQKRVISELTSSLVELRSLTLMLLREFDDESRLTSFQRERLHELRNSLYVEITPQNGSLDDR